MSALTLEIGSQLGRRSERWYSGLARQLSEAWWDAQPTPGLTVATYSTARVVTGDVRAPRHDVAWLGRSQNILVESIGEILHDRYTPLDIAPLTAAELPAEALSARLSEALDLTGLVPPVAEAVETLVRTIHPIKTQAPEYDVSYSDPDVPFSIFIGLHPVSSRHDAIRLAESVLHEAMHLQLTLIEAVEPLIEAHAETGYSPWQRRYRPTQGLVHGLYVFRVIQDFMGALPSDILDAETRHYIWSRMAQIECECRELCGLDQSSDLTSQGRKFVSALL